MLLFAMPASIGACDNCIVSRYFEKQTTTFLLSTSSPVLRQLLLWLDPEKAMSRRAA
jgi:hypothetical protein